MLSYSLHACILYTALYIDSLLKYCCTVGDGHPVLSLVTQVFSQVTARKYYQSAEAGLDFSFGLGPR